MSLENGNRLSLGSFLGAEYDDLPEPVRKQVQTFADVNVAWLAERLVDAGLTRERKRSTREGNLRCRCGGQLLARSRSDISLFDAIINSCRAAGLIPS
jgi:TetR/AcrR family transcriptional repressor of nem operon